jgi:N-acetylglucosamine kinase-like BadF-type ATPase
MARYFLGIDIGGTKSQALVADQRGQALGFAQGGPGNYETVGWEGLRQALHAVTGAVLASAGVDKGQLAAVGLGIAGYDWPAEREPTRQAIEALGLDAPYTLVNDALIALLAGAAEGWGVAVVAGTSNNCRGRDRQGREGRVTGCGPWFGEYGGAAELVARAVQAVALAWTRRGPPTRLSEAFLQLTGARDVPDLLEGLYLQRYQLSAAAAPLVFDVAARGDPVARETIRWAGRELGSLALGVIRQLDLEEAAFDLVLAGSLYDGSPALVEALSAVVHPVAPGARLVRLTAPPAVGGVLLAMEQAGLQTTALRPALLESTDRLLRGQREEE